MAQLYQNKEKNITVLGTETEFIGELTFKDKDRRHGTVPCRLGRRENEEIIQRKPFWLR